VDTLVDSNCTYHLVLTASFIPSLPIYDLSQLLHMSHDILTVKSEWAMTAKWKIEHLQIYNQYGFQHMSVVRIFVYTIAS